MTANGVAAWKDLDGDGIATATLNSGGGSPDANSVTTGTIVDGAIIDADVNANAAIAVSKLAAGTATYVLTSTAGTAVWSAPASGAPSGAAGGSLTGTYPNPTIATIPSGATATTQSAADGSTKVATTAYVDTADALKANLASPSFTGTPSLPTGTTGTTQSAADSSTKLATTAFVTTADNLKANLAGPTFTGTVTLPSTTVAVTPSASDNSTKPATTAYVDTADALKANIAGPTFTGITTAPEFSASGLTGATSASRYVGATASGAPVSGTFVIGDFIIDRTGSIYICTTAGSPGTWTQITAGGGAPSGAAGGSLTGTYPNPTIASIPSGATATTQTAADGSTKVATTAYVDTADALKANLAGPTFTGSPVLPTGTTGVSQSAGDNSTKFATTAYVDRSPEYFLNGAHTYRETFPRRSPASTATAPSGWTTGTMLNAAIVLYAGDVINNLTFISGATPESGGSHCWVALYDTSLSLVSNSQSTDQTGSAAFGAATAKTFALGQAFTVSTSGVYYASISITGTPPNLICGNTGNTVTAGTPVTGQKVLASVSGSALGASAPGSISSPTTIVALPYVCTS